MKKFLYWLLPIGWMGVIFLSSSTPYEKQDVKPLLNNVEFLRFLEPYLQPISFVYNQSVVSVDHLGLAGFLEFFLRKGAHVGVFFLLLDFLYIAFRKTTELSFNRAVAFSFFITVAYAVTDEIHQGFTPNRTPYLGDVLLDSIGALLAASLLTVIRKYQMRQKSLH